MSRERVFQLPECPSDLERVRSYYGADEGRIWTRKEPESTRFWTESTGMITLTWRELLRRYPGGLEEVIESEYEAALRRLRTGTRFSRDAVTTLYGMTINELDDVNTVILHVINGSDDD